MDNNCYINYGMTFFFKPFQILTYHFLEILLQKSMYKFFYELFTWKIKHEKNNKCIIINLKSYISKLKILLPIFNYNDHFLQNRVLY